MSKAKKSDERKEDLKFHAADKLLGSVRDHLLGLVKEQTKSYDAMTQDEQRRLISRIETQARLVINEAVHIIALEAGKTVRGSIDHVVCKDKVALKINIGRDEEHFHELINHIGKTCIISLASADKFMGADEAETDPDQGDLEETIDEGDADKAA